jgi:glycosyltransferase involved in cell wall biosynthesis
VGQEQSQLEVATRFYGLNLTVLDASANNLNAVLDRTALQNETVAIAIDAKALAAVDQSALLRSLVRRSGPIPLLILGVTPETDSKSLRAWSGGTVVGSQPVHGKLRYRVGSLPALTAQLSNLDLPFPADDAFYLTVSRESQAQVLLSVENDQEFFPSFVEADIGPQRVFVVTKTIPQSIETPLGAGDTIGAFARVAPVMLFVKYCAGERGWHAEHHYANLTIDDPWLREPYGYLDYKALLPEMEKHNFHTTIAFIPWNYDRSEPEVVSLFRTHPDRFSICIHGNNHDHDEFTEPHDDKVADIQQALARMEKFQNTTGIQYDQVMVFPHNIGSKDLLKELKTYNFLATINSSNVPIDENQPSDILSVLRPVTLAFGNFPSINRYTAEMPDSSAFVAINSFLDNPLFFYSHHAMFVSGAAAFDRVADKVNRIQPGTRWRSSGEIARHLYLVRQRADSDYDVTAFTGSLELDNTTGHEAVFYVSKEETDPAAVASVSVDGRTFPFDVRDGAMRLRIPVAVGGISRIAISYKNDLDLAAVSTSRSSVRVFALRMASDFRDIVLSRVRLGQAITDAYYKRKLSPGSVILWAAIFMAGFAYAVWGVVVKRNRRRNKDAPAATRNQQMISKSGAAPSEAHTRPRYVIITPVRDEEHFIESTIASIQQQSLRPVEWIVVDDGSTDNTGAILDRFAAENPWIRVVHRSNRGFRKAGGGVMEAFYAGYNDLVRTDWDFIVKLDGDLTLPDDYFEKCFQHFESDPDLGIGGGDIYHELDGVQKLESTPRFHVRGATKIYRKTCWDAIGGLWQAPGWDTIDEVKANMLGWKTYSFNEPRVFHHRFTGTAESLWRDKTKRGVACYVSGYHPLFLAASCLVNLGRRPYIAGSAAIAYGFIRSYWRGMPRVTDKHFIKYLRTQQLRRLCGLNTIWK